MRDKKIHGVSLWLGLFASIISILAFLTARPYLKDYFYSEDKTIEQKSFTQSDTVVSIVQQNPNQMTVSSTADKIKNINKSSPESDIYLESNLKENNIIQLNQEEKAPKYIYIDGFNNNANDWPIYSKEEGSCSITNGKYLLQNNVEGRQMSIAKVLTTNERTLDISVITKHLDGRMDSGYGIAFNANNDGSYYAFEIAGDSYAAFFGINNSVTTLIPWTKANAIKSQNNENNILRIRLKSNIFEMYINDILVNSHKIIFGMGWIGVIVENQQSVEFDDFSF